MFRWDPEPGQLFIREIISNGEIKESHLGCIVRPRMHPNALLSYVCLVELTFGVTSPKTSGTIYHDCIYGKEEMLNEERKVRRRLASCQDIHGLLELWDKKERIRPDKWIVHIHNLFLSENKYISQSEFDRLNDIAQQYITRNSLNRYQEK